LYCAKSFFFPKCRKRSLSSASRAGSFKLPCSKQAFQPRHLLSPRTVSSYWTDGFNPAPFFTFFLRHFPGPTSFFPFPASKIAFFFLSFRYLPDRPQPAPLRGRFASPPHVDFFRLLPSSLHTGFLTVPFRACIIYRNLFSTSRAHTLHRDATPT